MAGMSYADYEICPGCDRKALYSGEEDVPEGIEVWHASCRAEQATAAATAERERIVVLLRGVEGWEDFHNLMASLAGKPLPYPGDSGGPVCEWCQRKAHGSCDGWIGEPDDPDTGACRCECRPVVAEDEPGASPWMP